ncbi:MAG: SgcJ/EcaC family oxidoreductase [Terriglobia bacterium]
MRKPFSSFATLALMICLFGASVLAAPNEAEDVRKVVAGFATAWNRHDMDAFGKLFAADADFVTVAGFRMKGQQQIQMDHAWMHGTIPESSIAGANPAHYGMFRYTTMKFLHIDVRFLRKDVAVAHVNWELLGDARAPNPRHGVLLFVLARQDGGWQIAAAQNTEINRTVK